MAEKNVGAATSKAISATVKKLSRKKSKPNLSPLKRDLENATSE